MNTAAILDELRTLYTDVLGEKLVGLYLHGSLAFGCFEWSRSDIDFIAVVREELSPEEKHAIIAGLLELDERCPPKGLEMSVVLRNVCDPFLYPTPYELHFSNAHKAQYQADLAGYCEKMQGVDKDLAAHFTVIHTVGKVLCGLPIEDVFGSVPKVYYLDSILCDAADADEGMAENPVYYALNLCRVLAYLEEGKVLSKKGGGEWGLERLPSEHIPVLQKALADYAGGEPFQTDPNALSAYKTYMTKRISEYHPHTKI